MPKLAPPRVAVTKVPSHRSMVIRTFDGSFDEFYDMCSTQELKDELLRQRKRILDALPSEAHKPTTSDECHALALKLANLGGPQRSEVVGEIRQELAKYYHITLFGNKYKAAPKRRR